MNLVAIRGATNVSKNDYDEIIINSKELIKTIIEKNNLNIENIISIIFTSTKDITKAYPAIGARELGIVNAGLICLNEMYVENSMELCIRVMIHYQGNMVQNEVKHIYLKDTKALRPDLSNKEG